MVRFLRFGRSLVPRQSRNPSGCRPALRIDAKQTGRWQRGLAPNERAYTDFGKRSKGRGRRGLARRTRRSQKEGVGSRGDAERSEEHTSELQSLMRISYAVFCL